jgi:hypothetical protein
MPKARRGEIWIADLGYVAKVRPVLVLSVEYQGNERAVVTYVVRTTSVRGTNTRSRMKPEGWRPARLMRRVLPPFPTLNSNGAWAMSLMIFSPGLKTRCVGGSDFEAARSKFWMTLAYFRETS